MSNVEKKVGCEPNLNGLPASAIAALGRAALQQPLAYRVSWRGSKTPRGFRVGAVDIGWAQNGLISGEGQKHLGYYDRTIDCGGPSHDEQEMIVCCREEVTMGAGVLAGRVELLMDRRGPAGDAQVGEE